MAETKSFNELLLEKLETELKAIKKTVTGYYIDINSFYPYFVSPIEDNIQISEYPVAYAVVGHETPSEVSSNKSQVNNNIDVEIGILLNVSKANSEAEKENVKKSIKYYLRTGNTIRHIIGFNERYIGKTHAKITCYTHEDDSEKLILAFNFQIKTNLI